MAKVKFAFPIEEMHGKLKGNFGVAQRKSANCKGEKEPYTTLYGKRSTGYSAAELTNQAAFKAHSQAVALRMNTTSTATADQAAFKAQSTYKTLKEYVWAQVLAAAAGGGGGAA